jgi:hypothetical protein
MTPLFADAGLPMIFVQMPVMIGALIPVIILEALLIRRWVSLPYGEAFRGIAKANVRSTLVGIPIAWVAMFMLELVIGLPIAIGANIFDWKVDSPILEFVFFVISAAYVGPNPNESAVFVIPAAAAVLLIPSFYVSVWIERQQCLRAWPTADASAVRRGVYSVNVVSYGMLFLLACGWMLYELFTGTM